MKVSDERLQEACRQFACGVLSALKSPSLSPININLELDIWCYVTFKKGRASEHHGHFCFLSKNYPDLSTSQHTGGTLQMNMVKVLPLISQSKSNHYLVKKGHIVKATRLPLEKLCITIAKRPCNVNTLMENI